jgi:hypothetical protein
VDCSTLSFSQMCAEAAPAGEVGYLAECSACTSRFAFLLQYQDITSRPVEHARYNSSREQRQLNQPVMARVL